MGGVTSALTSSDTQCTDIDATDLSKVFALAKRYPHELSEFQNVVQTIEGHVPDAYQRTFAEMQLHLNQVWLGNICAMSKSILAKVTQQLATVLCLGVKTEDERVEIGKNMETNLSAQDRGQLAMAQQNIVKQIHRTNANKTLKEFADEIHTMRHDACDFIAVKSTATLPCDASVNQRVEHLHAKLKSAAKLDATEAYIMHLADRWLQQEAERSGSGDNTVCTEIATAIASENTDGGCQQELVACNAHRNVLLGQRDQMLHREAQVRREALTEGVAKGYKDEYQRGYEAALREAPTQQQPTAPVSSPLPPSWRAETTGKGETYYWNTHTGESTWARPL